MRPALVHLRQLTGHKIENRFGEIGVLEDIAFDGNHVLKQLFDFRSEVSDAEMGLIQDCIVDYETLQFRYLVVKTRNGWPFKSVLLSSRWIEKINWEEKIVSLNVTKSDLISSPAYQFGTPIRREFEVALFEHYQRSNYWTHANNLADEFQQNFRLMEPIMRI